MKIVLENCISVLIREEDFTKATIGQEEVSYLRPNGTQVVIKFSQAVLATGHKNENREVKSAREEQRIAAAEVQRQNRREMWAKEQAIRDEEVRQAIENNYKDLEAKLHNMSHNLNNELKKYNSERQVQIMKLQEEIKNLRADCDESKTYTDDIVEGVENFFKLVRSHVEFLFNHLRLDRKELMEGNFKEVPRNKKKNKAW